MTTIFDLAIVGMVPFQYIWMGGRGQKNQVCANTQTSAKPNVQKMNACHAFQREESAQQQDEQPSQIVMKSYICACVCGCILEYCIFSLINMQSVCLQPKKGFLAGLSTTSRFARRKVGKNGKGIELSRYSHVFTYALFFDRLSQKLRLFSENVCNSFKKCTIQLL